MAFKMDAYVLNQKKGGGSWTIDVLNSLGVWDGEELKNSGDCPDGTFTGIHTKFQAMLKAKPDKPKPMTFSWVPTTKDEKTLFQSKLRNATFAMRIGVTDKNNNYWTLSFDGIKLTKPPTKKQGVERVEANYLGYNKHPD